MMMLESKMDSSRKLSVGFVKGRGRIVKVWGIHKGLDNHKDLHRQTTIKLKHFVKKTLREKKEL